MKNDVKILLGMVITAVIFFCSCGKGDTGSHGPAGTDGTMVTVFQDGSTYSGEDNTMSGSAFMYNNRSFYTDITGNAFFQVGSNSASVGTERGFVKFNLLNCFPPGTQIIKAELDLFGSSTNGGGNTITAYAVTSNCTISELCWVSGTASTSWNVPGGDYSAASASNSVPVSVTTTALYVWQINVLTVQSWIDTPDANYGLLLKGDGENNIQDVYFEGAGYGILNQRPSLKITYKLP
jgi:hypothetical protein